MLPLLLLAGACAPEGRSDTGGEGGPAPTTVVYADVGATFGAAAGVAGGEGGLVVTTPAGDAHGAVLTVLARPEGDPVVACADNDARFAATVWPDGRWLDAGPLDGLGRAYAVVHVGATVSLVSGPLTGAVGPSAALGTVLVPGVPGPGEIAGTVLGGATGDGDGDGVGDLLLADAVAGTAALLPGPLDGIHPVTEAGRTWAEVPGMRSLRAAGDLDGDGYGDALAITGDGSAVLALRGGPPGEGEVAFRVAVDDLGGVVGEDTLAAAPIPGATPDRPAAFVLGWSRAGPGERGEVRVLELPDGGGIDADAPLTTLLGDPDDRLGEDVAVEPGPDGALWVVAPGCATSACDAAVLRFRLDASPSARSEAATTLLLPAGPVGDAAGLLHLADHDGDGAAELGVETRRGAPALPATLALFPLSAFAP